MSNNFSELQYPYISYFKVNWQFSSFWENLCVDAQSYIEKFNVFRFVIRRLKNPPEVNWIEFHQCWIYLAFLRTCSTALRKALSFFVISKARSAYLETLTSRFRLKSESWGQNLENCEGGRVGFWNSFFFNKKIKKYVGKNCLKIGWG